MRDSAVAELRKAIGAPPSPLWTVETALISAAIRLSESGTRYNGPAAVLRKARERAAWRAAPTIPPSTSEIQHVLNDGDQEARTQLLARLVLAQLENTKGSASSHLEGGPEPPGVGRGPD